MESAVDTEGRAAAENTAPETVVAESALLVQHDEREDVRVGGAWGCLVGGVCECVREPLQRLEEVVRQVCTVRLAEEEHQRMMLRDLQRAKEQAQKVRGESR